MQLCHDKKWHVNKLFKHDGVSDRVCICDGLLTRYSKVLEMMNFIISSIMGRNKRRVKADDISHSSQDKI